MKSYVALAIIVLSLSVMGVAQQNKPFKVKHSTSDKEVKSAPVAKMPTSGTTSSSKELQSVERQSAKPVPASHTKTQAATKIKPMQDKPNPPINFAENGGGKKAGTVNQSSNPYKGRLKQKRAQ